MVGKLSKKDDIFYLFVDASWSIASTDTKDNRDNKLSLKNCQEIELGYDLDELADELHKNYPDWAPPVEHYDYTRGVIDGAKTLLEIIGDKKFSEEDMMQLVKSSFYAGLSKGQGKNQDFNIDDYVKEHLQQTEWDVEIATAKRMENGKSGLDVPVEKIKLDPDGCLILKRI